jgi:hypothetical protein
MLRMTYTHRGLPVRCFRSSSKGFVGEKTPRGAVLCLDVPQLTLPRTLTSQLRIESTSLSR